MGATAVGREVGSCERYRVCRTAASALGKKVRAGVVALGLIQAYGTNTITSTEGGGAAIKKLILDGVGAPRATVDADT